jgi:flagellar motor switch protein FliN
MPNPSAEAAAQLTSDQPSIETAAPGTQHSTPPAEAKPGHPTSELPDYTRSLLHIQVPISVTLATKRQPIGQIMDLGAGSIIHFEKSCEEMLDLYVGDHPVAKGEAIKVGEKFGLRITSVILPEERFKPVNGR